MNNSLDRLLKTEFSELPNWIQEKIKELEISRPEEWIQQKIPTLDNRTVVETLASPNGEQVMRDYFAKTSGRFQ